MRFLLSIPPAVASLVLHDIAMTTGSARVDRCAEFALAAYYVIAGPALE